MAIKIFTPFPILRTDRLTLRQPVSDDYKEIFALRSDDSVNKYLDREPAKSIEDAKKFILTITENIKKSDSFYWVITLNSNNRLIGTICLFDFSNDSSKAEIGYELLPDFQGKGIMQEAVLKVIDYAFEILKFNVLEAYTHIENQSSTALLEKLNFKKQSHPTPDANSNFIIFKLRKNE